MDRPSRSDSQRFPADSFECLISEFRDRWKRGERPRAESYLDRIDPDQPFQATELIYTEYCLERGTGDPPSTAGYLARFPQYAEELERLFALDLTFATSDFSSWTENQDLPQAGDSIGHYYLRSVLGEGGIARVFLAEQENLKGKLIVIKVSRRPSKEPWLLARLRHPHIVDVLQSASTEDGQFHLTWMPFLGGATLASLLEAIESAKARPRSGADLLNLLDRVSSPEYPLLEETHPYREHISKLSYTKAAAWLIARIAGALDHAARRGVTHGDVKPSNILVTSEGSPQLFDFNISIDWNDPRLNTGMAETTGGTLWYLSPERLEILLRRERISGFHSIDAHQADLYALGLVLLELISGRLSDQYPNDKQDPYSYLSTLIEKRGGTSRPFHKAIRKAPASLRPTIERLLAPKPEDRYRRGRDLASDLDRWIADQTSENTRVHPALWVAQSFKRHRQWVVLGLVAFVAVATTLLIYHASVERALRLRAAEYYDLGLDRSQSSPIFQSASDYWQSVPSPQRGYLDYYKVLDDPHWIERDEVKYLRSPFREELEAALLGQYLEHVQYLSDPSLSPQNWDKALDLIDRVLARYRLKAYVDLRRKLVDQIKARQRKVLASPTPPSTQSAPKWLDDYVLGVSLLEDHARLALNAFDRCLAERQGLFWADYLAAGAHLRLGEYAKAESRLRHCVNHRPHNAALLTQHAAVLLRMGQSTESIARCDQALALSADYPRALFLKATQHLLSAQDDLSIESIQRFLESEGRIHQRTDALRLRIATLVFQGKSRRIEISDVRTVLQSEPDDCFMLMLYAGLLAQSRNGRTVQTQAIKEERLKIYESVINRYPRHLPARYERAILLHELRGLETAAPEIEQIINDPRFEELVLSDRRASRFCLQYAAALYDANRFGDALSFASREFALPNLDPQLECSTIFFIAKTAFKLNPDKAQASDEVASLLRNASSINPVVLTTWFPNEPDFNGYTEAIYKKVFFGIGDREGYAAEALSASRDAR